MPAFICSKEVSRDSDLFGSALFVVSGFLQRIFIWETVFTEAELSAELEAAGFTTMEVYGDIRGAQPSSDSETLCFVVEK